VFSFSSFSYASEFSFLNIGTLAQKDLPRVVELEQEEEEKSALFHCLHFDALGSRFPFSIPTLLFAM